MMVQHTTTGQFAYILYTDCRYVINYQQHLNDEIDECNH